MIFQGGGGGSDPLSPPLDPHLQNFLYILGRIDYGAETTNGVKRPGGKHPGGGGGGTTRGGNGFGAKHPGFRQITAFFTCGFY